MSKNIEIKLIINPSLREYFEAGMRKEHINFSAAEELTRFLALILNDTMYPLSSSMTGKAEISLSYRPRAYADPIF
jgi:hypothetical protein